MKKLLTIVLLLLSGLTVGAQEGKWSTGMIKGDELKGYTGGPYYRYDVESMGSFVLWDWNDWAFKISTNKGTFDLWYYQSTGTYFINVMMGLYTMDGKLTDKFENEIAADHTGRVAWINKKGLYSWSETKHLKKMMRALKSGNGYVRIVCARKGAPEFDLLVMPYK